MKFKSTPIVLPFALLLAVKSNLQLEVGDGTFAFAPWPTGPPGAVTEVATDVVEEDKDVEEGEGAETLAGEHDGPPSCLPSGVGNRETLLGRRSQSSALSLDKLIASTANLFLSISLKRNELLDAQFSFVQESLPHPSVSCE